MQPVEINAGAYYLRQLRCDTRLDDRPALVTAFADDEMRRWAPRTQLRDINDAALYIAGRTAQWAQDQRCSWAVCEPTTGDLVGEIGLSHLDLDAGTAEAGCWVAAQWRGRGVATHALGAALRFGYGALGLSYVDYVHVAGNTASQRVAQKCGFRQHERHGDLVVWRRGVDS